MSPVTGPIIFIGGGVASVSAIESLRERGHDGPLVLMTGEPHLPYDRPPLSKDVLVGDAPEAVPLRPPSFYESMEVDLRIGAVAVSLDPSTGSVVDAHGVVTMAEAVVLGTGGAPRTLSVPGADLDGVCVLRTLDDALALRERLLPGARIVVVGGGFIGTEVAAAAVGLGLEVTMLEAAPAPLLNVLPGLAAHVVERHRARGVLVRAGVGVEAFVGTDRVTGVRLAHGEVVPADVVVVGVGMRPRDELAASAGLAVGDGVHVDRCGRTSRPGVYAIGDVASTAHGTGRRRLEHWQSAVRSGRSVAASLLDLPPEPDHVPWFWSDQLDLNIQLAGHPAPDDGRVLRGDPASGTATMLFHRDGVLTGVATLNNGRDVRPLIDLIAAGVRVDPAELAGADLDLRKVARAMVRRHVEANESPLLTENPMNGAEAMASIDGCGR